jgi:signal recognition particle receptor subunit beta
VYNACRGQDGPVTVTELAARLGISRGAVKMLACDLVADGHLHAHTDYPGSGALGQALHHLDAPLSVLALDFPDHPTAVKIVVAGGAGAGKSTLIGAISDAPPARIEEPVRVADGATNDPDRRALRICSGTVALNHHLSLALFGARLPGERHEALRRDLLRGCSCAVVVVHPRRIDEARDAIEHVGGCPFALVLNLYDDIDGDELPDTPQLRTMLGAPSDVPVVMCDVRNRGEVRGALRELLRYASRSPRTLAGPHPSGLAASPALRHAESP